MKTVTHRLKLQHLGRMATLAGVCVAGFVALSSPASAAPITVYSTGVCLGANAGDVGCSGGLLPTTGVADNNWQIVSGISGGTTGTNSSITEAPVAGAYAAADAASEWLTPAGGTVTPGWPNYFPNANYTAQTTFDLTGYDPTSLILSIEVSADNLFSVSVDGTTVFNSSQAGCSAETTPLCYKSLYALNLTNALLTSDGSGTGFLSGLNTIQVTVTNTSPAPTTSSPTAFRVELSGSANPLAVPEPASMTLLGAGLAGLAFLRRRA